MAEPLLRHQPAKMSICSPDNECRFRERANDVRQDYFTAYATANPTLSCRYFSWEDRGDLTRLLNGEAKGGHVSLVGHSYGGDTCFWRMGNMPKVDLLISIDPVARFERDWTSIRAGCVRWLNVRAEPDDAHRMFDDTIAAIGGKYPRPPAPLRRVHRTTA